MTGMSRIREIRVLYFAGCPHSTPTLELVRRVVSECQVAAIVEPVEVRSEQEAQHLRFLGSPTVLVDGIDIDASARGRSDFALSCRWYGGSGVPAAEMLL